MKTQSFEDWMQIKKPLNQGFVVLKTQEEKCRFCREHILPAIIDIPTRPLSDEEVNIPDIEEWTWEVVTPKG
jgi:hypothetical protein